MYMKDWIQRLDDFLKMTGNEVVEHAGKISHKKALEKAHQEYNMYLKKSETELNKVEKDFVKTIENTAKKIEKKKKK